MPVENDSLSSSGDHVILDVPAVPARSQLHRRGVGVDRGKRADDMSDHGMSGTLGRDVGDAERSVRKGEWSSPRDMENGVDEDAPLVVHNMLLNAGDDDVFTEQREATWHAAMLKKLTRGRRKRNESRAYTLWRQCLAELFGTMFLVVFGVGVVAVSILTNTSEGLWQVASVWGFGVAIAILATGSVSGGHLNPAVSLAMAVFRPRDFSFVKLLPYWAAQYIGGILGGAINLTLFRTLLQQFEDANEIVRGDAKSVLSARAFGAYFPDPGLVAEPDGLPNSVVSPAFAFLIEAWGTGVLMFVILALTDPRQKIVSRSNKELLPFYIGFTIAILVALYAPLTQAALNPARDFGPRLVALMAGWGKIAIPGPRNGFWVYIVGPKLGAVLGALVYELVINPGLTDLQ